MSKAPEKLALQTFTTVPVHGLPIADITLSDLYSYMLQAVQGEINPDSKPTMIAYVNAHTCNLAVQQPDFRQALLDFDLLYLDGNGPRLAAWLAGYRLAPRLTAADWFDDFCRLWSDHQHTLYFLGSPPGVADRAAEILLDRHPDLKILGTHHGFLSKELKQEAIGEIRARQPDLLLLAMGSPSQELLMQELKQVLDIPLIWGAGGVLDYTSGAVPRAPSWMLNLSLEWLGRMLIEPRRLVPRYAVGVPLFLLRSIRYALRERLEPHRSPNP